MQELQPCVAPRWVLAGHCRPGMRRQQAAAIVRAFAHPCDRGLSRIAQRRVLLDIEPLDRRGVEIVVGPEAARMDAVDGAQIVDLVDVAGDAERPHDLARIVADELAAAFQEQGPVGKLGERLHEGRLLLGLLQHLARGAIERKRRESLAVGDLEAQQRGAVLLVEGLHAPTGVEHDRAQRIGVALLGGREGALDDPDGLGEADGAHAISWMAALERGDLSTIRRPALQHRWSMIPDWWRMIPAFAGTSLFRKSASTLAFARACFSGSCSGGQIARDRKASSTTLPALAPCRWWNGSERVSRP